MDKMGKTLRDVIAYALRDVSTPEPSSPDSYDPPPVPEIGEWRETEDGLIVQMGDAEYRVRIERA